MAATAGSVSWNIGSLQNKGPCSLPPGFHGGYSPDGIEAVSPVSSPSISHEKGAKLLQDVEKGHGEHDMRQKQQGEGHGCCYCRGNLIGPGARRAPARSLVEGC